MATQTSKARERLVARTVAAAELMAAEPMPDPVSAAVMDTPMRVQGVRPVPSDLAGGVTCPECGAPLVIAPKNGRDYVVCYAALGSDGGCWYSRETNGSGEGIRR
jgi:hypothetical protein